MNSISQFFKIDKFKLVYWAIALATAQHTAWGAATTMQGTQSEGDWFWWAQGIAFAIAIDFSMVMIAEKIRSGVSKAQVIELIKRLNLQFKINWYIVAFVLVGLLSFYFQLLYTWKHAGDLQAGAGITTDWQSRLRELIDARIIITPSALPAIAILYTIAGLGKGGEVQPKQSRAMQPTQSSKQSMQSDAIHIEREAMPQLMQPRNIPQLVAATAVREDGKVVGWICPGCNAELSISGWSRHKKSCNKLLTMSENGNGHTANGHGER